jgi:hypothetical protein
LAPESFFNSLLRPEVIAYGFEARRRAGAFRHGTNKLPLRRFDLCLNDIVRRQRPLASSQDVQRPQG